jgi:hypothetical protein
MHDVHVREAEQNVLAEQALEQFESKLASPQLTEGQSIVPARQSVGESALTKRRP